MTLWWVAVSMVMPRYNLNFLPPTVVMEPALILFNLSVSIAKTGTPDSSMMVCGKVGDVAGGHAGNCVGTTPSKTSSRNEKSQPTCIPDRGSIALKFVDKLYTFGGKKL